MPEPPAAPDSAEPARVPCPLPETGPTILFAPHSILPMATAGSVSSPARWRGGARARRGSRTESALGGGHCWDRAQGECPHMVAPVPTGPLWVGTPLLAATHGATGHVAPQLCVPGGGAPRPRDPPRPPSCFAEPPARSRRRPRLVALFQPRSASMSSSAHLTDPVHRLPLPLPAPKPPQHAKARAQPRQDGPAWPGMRPACPQQSRGTAGCAVVSPSQAAARRPRVPGALCRRSSPAALAHRSSRPFAFHGERGARPPAPAAPAPSLRPVLARLWAPRSQLSSPSSCAMAPRRPRQGPADGLPRRSANGRASPRCPRG